MRRFLILGFLLSCGETQSQRTAGPQTNQTALQQPALALTNGAEPSCSDMAVEIEDAYVPNPASMHVGKIDDQSFYVGRQVWVNVKVSFPYSWSLNGKAFYGSRLGPTPMLAGDFERVIEESKYSNPQDWFAYNMNGGAVQDEDGRFSIRMTHLLNENETWTKRFGMWAGAKQLNCEFKIKPRDALEECALTITEINTDISVKLPSDVEGDVLYRNFEDERFSRPTAPFKFLAIVSPDGRPPRECTATYIPSRTRRDKAHVSEILAAHPDYRLVPGEEDRFRITAFTSRVEKLRVQFHHNIFFESGTDQNAVHYFNDSGAHKRLLFEPRQVTADACRKYNLLSIDDPLTSVGSSIAFRDGYIYRDKLLLNTGDKLMVSEKPEGSIGWPNEYSSELGSVVLDEHGKCGGLSDIPKHSLSFRRIDIKTGELIEELPLVEPTKMPNPFRIFDDEQKHYTKRDCKWPVGNPWREYYQMKSTVFQYWGGYMVIVYFYGAKTPEDNFYKTFFINPWNSPSHETGTVAGSLSDDEILELANIMAFRGDQSVPNFCHSIIKAQTIVDQEIPLVPDVPKLARKAIRKSFSLEPINAQNPINKIDLRVGQWSITPFVVELQATGGREKVFPSVSKPGYRRLWAYKSYIDADIQKYFGHLTDRQIQLGVYKIPLKEGTYARFGNNNNKINFRSHSDFVRVEMQLNTDAQSIQLRRELILPQNISRPYRPPSDGSSGFQLSWSKPNNVTSYDLQVNKIGGAKNIVRTWLDDTRFTADIKIAGSYRYRIRSAGPWSKYRWFVVRSRDKITLSWPEIPGISEYDVQINAVHDLDVTEKNVVRKRTLNNQLVIDAKVLKPDSDYRFRVRTVTGWSKYQFFDK